jgi:hypothetical protein
VLEARFALFDASIRLRADLIGGAHLPVVGANALAHARIEIFARGAYLLGAFAAGSPASFIELADAGTTDAAIVAAIAKATAVVCGAGDATTNNTGNDPARRAFEHLAAGRRGREFAGQIVKPLTIHDAPFPLLNDRMPTEHVGTRRPGTG